jgi:hypothetical protein
MSNQNQMQSQEEMSIQDQLEFLKSNTEDINLNYYLQTLVDSIKNLMGTRDDIYKNIKDVYPMIMELNGYPWFTSRVSDIGNWRKIVSLVSDIMGK